MPLCDARRTSDKPPNIRLWLSARARMRQNDGAAPAAPEHRIMTVILPCLIRFALAAVFAMLASAAPAQTYPAPPIRLQVSFRPRGAADHVSRQLRQPP